MQFRSFLSYFFLGGVFLLAGCSSSLNDVWVSEDDKLRIDTLLDQAIMNLDKGDYDTANDLIQKAARVDPYNEKIAQTKGYIVLGQAGFDVFSATLKLMESETSSSKEKGNFLNVLYEILIVDEEKDFPNIGKKDDGSSVSMFNGLTVYVPELPGSLDDSNSPRYKVPLLNKANDAIKIICPFVSREVIEKYKTKARYKDCQDLTARGENPSQSHMLFSLAHLAEAVLFNSVLLYSGTQATSQANSNWFQRANKITTQSTSFGSDKGKLKEYVSAVSGFSDGFNKAFDVLREESLFSALLDDLNIAIDSFSQVSGLPSSFTKALKSLVESISSPTGNQAEELTKLKTQLSSAITSQLQTPLKNAINALPAGDTTNKQSLCNSASSLGMSLSECA